MSAAAVTATGLLLPMEAAVAAAGPCANGSDAGTTHSLTGDCVLSATWVVEPGWTIDGNGHTITLAAGFTGPAIASTAGTAGMPAPSMNVEHLTLNAAGSSAGILFSGATGGVHDVRITSASGTDYGVEVDNMVGAAFGTTGQVKVDNGTTISGYQKAAVYVLGNAKFSVLRAAIGSQHAVPSQGVAGILATAGAHGSIKENAIHLSDAEPGSPSVYGAGVRIVGDPLKNRRVEVKRNIFSGAAADFGISVENPTQAFKMTAAIDCNLFSRNDSSPTDPYGVGVGAWGGPKTNVVLSNATFEGNWKHATGNVAGATVTSGPANVHNGNCAPSAPSGVFAAGGDRRSRVTWTAASAPDYAPLTGYQVTAKAAGQPTVTANVGPTATSVVLTGLRNKGTYDVTVTAQSNGGQANGADRLYPTKIALKAKHRTIHRGSKARLHGKLSSSDPNAHLRHRKVTIWAKARGGKWKHVATVRTTAKGNFHHAFKPRKRTSYKAMYGGHPDLASHHGTKVRVKR